MTRLHIRVYAKVNLALFVHPKVGGANHPIASLMQTVSLSDELAFESNESGALRCFSEPAVTATPKEDLVWKTLRKLQERTGVKRGMTAWLTKRIPVGGGLGGGSADAAATLVAANRLWDLGISEAELAAVGAELGSDVPFFIEGGTRWVEGSGERLTRLPDLKGLWFVLWFPGFPVPSSEAYQWWDESPVAVADGKEQALKAAVELGRVDGVVAFLDNSFLPVLSRRVPEYEQWLAAVRESGALYASISGSGSTVFGLYEAESPAREAARRLRSTGRTKLWVVHSVPHGVEVMPS